MTNVIPSQSSFTAKIRDKLNIKHLFPEQIRDRDASALHQHEAAEDPPHLEDEGEVAAERVVGQSDPGAEPVDQQQADPSRNQLDHGEPGEVREHFAILPNPEPYFMLCCHCQLANRVNRLWS